MAYGYVLCPSRQSTGSSKRIIANVCNAQALARCVVQPGIVKTRANINAREGREGSDPGESD
jgi:hypothetical protein